MNKVSLTIIASILTIGSAQAANFKDNEAAIEYRQAAFTLIAHNFGDMAAMVKGKKDFDQTVFEQRAKNVAALSHFPAEGFITESSEGKTEALAKIWKNKSDFDNIMKQFQLAAADLVIAAKTGDKGAIKKAFGNTGKNCKSCHDTYKKD